MLTKYVLNRWRLLGLLLLLLVVTWQGYQVVAVGERQGAQMSAPTAQASMPLTIDTLGAASNCDNQAGWQWSLGPEPVMLAAQIQALLAREGWQTAVRGQHYGETNGCDQFHPLAMDFDVDVISLALSQSEQQQLADKIQAIVEPLSVPRLGQLKVHFVDDVSVIRPQLERPMAPMVVMTEADAQLGWQESGIFITANQLMNINVTDGLWTDWVGEVPYNNGVGSDYICTDVYPPDVCVEPMPAVRKGALIGQVGEYRFEIGSGTVTSIPVSGLLELRINDADDGLFDNDGVLTVVVTPAIDEPDISNRLYIIIYNPLLSNGQYLNEYFNWSDHMAQATDIMNLFASASNGHFQYDLVATTVVTHEWPIKRDGFQYTEADYLAVMAGQMEPHQPDAVDYNVIVNNPLFDICGRVNRNEIDEVWVFNGPWFGFWESTLVGPDAFWFNSPPVPLPHDCQRTIPIMGPNPERPDTNGHGEGHRMESTMMQIYGSWVQNRTDHNWERYALVDARSPDYNYSGCGNIHYPPNGVIDYDYSNPAIAQTNCADFVNYPNLGDPAETVAPIDCTGWDCYPVGYMHYWFSNLPANDGCGPDGVANDWWIYYAQPALALRPWLGCLQHAVYLPSVTR